MRFRVRSTGLVVLIVLAPLPLVAVQTAATGAAATQEVGASEADQGPQPFARTRLEPGDRVTVGQPVTVVVEVLVPNWFTAAPWFPAVDVDDAIAIYEDRGINFTEKIDGLTWSGQSRNYKVYPQRPGRFEIDAIPVWVRYFSDTTGPRTQVTVSPLPVLFEAVFPAEAGDLTYFISTTELAIEQSFDRAPETLVVGEAFVRTITITVKDALSMVVPPLVADPLPGLAAYSDPPEVRDEGGERGKQIVGTRIERTTYVAEQSGDYRLSGIELAWWDIGSERMRTATLPPLDVHVEPNPDLVAEIPLPPDDAVANGEPDDSKARVSLLALFRRWGVPVAAAAVALWLLSRLWRRLQPPVSRWLAEVLARRRSSEATYFTGLRKAALSGDAKATWNAWSAWLDRRHSGLRRATIRGFVETAGDTDLAKEAEKLEAALFGPHGTKEGPGWSGRRLVRGLVRVRRRAATAGGGREAQEVLGRLNPGR